ncbi:hypothetical protein ACQB6R_10015 [Propionibacteriaceae bacterium G1746]|uniref:hypothetical protein n=1 Tax=Aestuariimicrobium sp. G57 TaxID=3418485 RepID=UPI003C19DC14
MIAALVLEVLPGWPEPEPFSPLFLVLLTVVGPLALLAVISIVAWTPRLMHRGRAEARAEGVAIEAGELDGSAARRAALDA